MKRIVDGGLVALALRRSLPVGVLAWTLLVLTFTLVTGTAADASEPVAAGLARESVWYAFVLLVAPLIVVRAVSSVVPWRVTPDTGARHGASQAAATRHGDAPWLATRAVSNAVIATSTWLGVTIAAILLTVPFAVAAELHGGQARAPVATGTIDGPRERWAASGAPLVWHADLPQQHSGSRTSARIELGLGAGSGAAAEVELRARRGSADATIATTRIGNRGTIEVELPAGDGGVDFQLACKGDEARVCVLSERVELWSLDTDSRAHPATTAMLARLVLALCAWLALSLGVSRFLSPSTAALTVLAAWVPHWWSEAGTSAFSSRFLPGADLFEALAVVGDGRAPAWPALESIAGTALLVLLGLVLACAGLRTWRVSR